EGTPLAFASGVLHCIRSPAHQRPHKPPQRPARAEHHPDPPRRLWPFLARLKGIPAGRLPPKITRNRAREPHGPPFFTANREKRRGRPRGADHALALTKGLHDRRKAKRQPRRIGVSA